MTWCTMREEDDMVDHEGGGCHGGSCVLPVCVRVHVSCSPCVCCVVSVCVHMLWLS